MAQLTIKDIKTLEYERPDIQRGYANQTLSVNLSDSAISIKPVDEKMKEVFVGGKGFDLWLLWNAVKSTTRRDYYYDILLAFAEPARIALVNSILNELDETAAAKAGEIRAILGGAVAGPVAVVPDHGWNAERLNQYLKDIDHCIATADYAHAVALAYTCLEGFYKAFVAQCIPDQTKETEIIALAKCIKKYLSEAIDSYPDEALSMVMHVSHTVDRARNRFSEAHFEEEAARWLAVFVRDLVNTQIRLLLHFF